MGQEDPPKPATPIVLCCPINFDAIFSEYITHVTDPKPITARQCVKTLAQIGVMKPQYIPQILERLEHADLSQYNDSMRPLIEKDIAETKKRLIPFSMKK